MNSCTMLNKKQILNLTDEEFYNSLSKKEYEQIYNLMAENFSEIVREEHYLHAFLEFFKKTAENYEDEYLINIELFIAIFIDELKRKN